MEQRERRKFTALESDLVCEVKTIKQQIDTSMALHNHDGHEILLILSGKVNFYTEFGGVRLERGDLICIHEFDFHRAELVTLDEYDRILINVRGNTLAEASGSKMSLGACFERNALNPINVTHLSEEELEKITGYAKELQKTLKGKQPEDELLADAFLKLIMVSINRHFIKHDMLQHTEIMPNLVSETFQYIENHLEEEITLGRLEEQLHYNGTYISRCFKKITGITLQQFIIAKKITLSCTLLRKGYAPCDVCYMTGFNNYSNYSRTFSKQMGKSPKKYQMEYQL